MPRLIKDESIIEDDWLTVMDAEQLPALAEDVKVCIPLELWQQREANVVRGDAVSVWLPGDTPAETVDEIFPDLSKHAMIAIHIPVFSDGRAYSLAQRLRARHGFAGELRAIGDVLPDQLYYLRRCGFNAFVLREDKEPEPALERFNDFSESYQSAADQQAPLFLRRSE